MIREDSTAIDTIDLSENSSTSPRQSSQTTSKMTINFIAQQLQDMINNAINSAVTNVINNLHLPAGLRGERGPLEESEELGELGSATVEVVGASSSNSRWNAIELGYFNSYLNKFYEESEIITMEKNVYYRSVILFVERIHNLIAMKEEAVVRINVNICFRDSTLT